MLDGKPRLPTPAHRTEAERALWALEQLRAWFHIQREVLGTHCHGQRLRIDAVLRPKDPSGWKDADPAFGVEFKIADQRGFDTRNFTSWAAQAVDYTHVDWDGYGKLMIFACPSPIEVFRRMDHLAGGAFLMSRLLSQLGVGELCQLEREGWALMMHGDHVLWSQHRGVRQARQWSIKTRTGSR